MVFFGDNLKKLETLPIDWCLMRCTIRQPQPMEGFEWTIYENDYSNASADFSIASINSIFHQRPRSTHRRSNCNLLIEPKRSPQVGFARSCRWLKRSICVTISTVVSQYSRFMLRTTKRMMFWTSDWVYLLGAPDWIILRSVVPTTPTSTLLKHNASLPQQRQEGDFWRRFDEMSILMLMQAINKSRLQFWT